MNTTMMMCPHCGWSYDPSLWKDGYRKLPDHDTVCPGSRQCPRNAASDKRLLWSEEQETKMFDSLANLAQSHEKQLDDIARAIGYDPTGRYGTIAEKVRQEITRLRTNLGAADIAHQFEQQRADHFEEENDRLKLLLIRKNEALLMFADPAMWVMTNPYPATWQWNGAGAWKDPMVFAKMEAEADEPDNRAG